MRGCLGVLVLAAAVVVTGAWFGGPALASVVVDGALDVAGVEARNRTVRVESDPPIEVLGGHADRVVIGGDEVVIGDLDAARLDVTLGDVDLVARTFGTVEGRLEGVVLTAGDGSPTNAARVELLGPAHDVLATVRISGSEVNRLATGALARDAGLTVDNISLEAADTIVFTSGPNSIEGRLAVGPDGALVAMLGLPGEPRITLLSPDNPFTLTGVSVDDADLVLIGRIDLTGLAG